MSGSDQPNTTTNQVTRDVALESRRVLVALGAIVAVIALLAVLAMVGRRLGGGSYPGARTIIKYFLLDREDTVPTWISSAMLLGASGLTAILRHLDVRDRRRGWGGLAVIFLLMSVDETTSLHETVTGPVRRALVFGDWPGLGWLIPAAIVLVAVIAAYGRFVWRLPGPTRTRLLLAGAVYATGAVVMELVGRWVWEANGAHSLGYDAVATFEEVLELCGLALLAYALVFHTERFRPRLVREQPPLAKPER